MTVIPDLKTLYEIDDSLWLEETIELLKAKRFGSSVCVMQSTRVIRDETLIERDITAIFVNCFRSRAN
jgi:hypothetical protein